MPSPKSKHSKSRRDKRRANWKLTVPGLVECPQCHAKHNRDTNASINILNKEDQLFKQRQKNNSSQ